VLDGVDTRPTPAAVPIFHPLPAPTDDEMAKILEGVHERIPTPLSVRRPDCFEIGGVSGHLLDGSRPRSPLLPVPTWFQLTESQRVRQELDQVTNPRNHACLHRHASPYAAPRSRS
jgi:hypothetical protein